MRRFIFFIALYGVAAFAAQQEGQGSFLRDIYREVPEGHQREWLREAVDILVDAQKERDWKTVWRFYDRKRDDANHRNLGGGEETEESFLKEMGQARRLVEFVPISVARKPSRGDWIVQGCAAFVGDMDEKGHRAHVYARYADLRWYLSTVELDKEIGPDGRTTTATGCSVDPYGLIPREQRSLLRLTVEKLVAAQKARDWETLWQLYDKSYGGIPFNKEGDEGKQYEVTKPPEETEASFLKRMGQTSQLVEFRPTKVAFHPLGNDWLIEGCASFEGVSSGKGGRQALVHARWEGSRWSLDVIQIALYQGIGRDGKLTAVHECSLDR